MEPRAKQVFETVLYADDLHAAADFYTRVIGLKLLSQTDLMLVLLIGNQYLLIFNPTKSSAFGCLVPPHGATGEGHIAFVAAESELDSWRNKLRQLDVKIESEVPWNNGERGTSLYFRDPAGNSVELAPPVIWQHLDPH